MLTRRAVLKGTAAASIGAIAAAHGAEAADGFALDVGYGDLTGGAVGGFAKQPDAFQIALKFQKAAAELFFKEQLGGVAVFFKLFNKTGWSAISSEPLDQKYFPDLKTSDLYFSKVYAGGAKLFLKNDFNKSYIEADVVSSVDGVFFKYDLKFDTTEIIL